MNTKTYHTKKQLEVNLLDIRKNKNLIQQKTDPHF